MSPVPVIPQNRWRATGLLVTVSLLWLAMVIAGRFFPAQHAIFYFLARAFEAGMVGGLADWYAVTVLFRNPFGRLPLPHFIADHTAIIPRNQQRLASALGRFIQENFLVPDVFASRITATNLSEKIALWLAEAPNRLMVSRELFRFMTPSLTFLQTARMEQLGLQAVSRVMEKLPLNQLLASSLGALVKSDRQHHVFNLLLTMLIDLMDRYPEQTRQLIAGSIEKSGMIRVLVKGASLFGVNVQQQAADVLIATLREIRDDADHPIRERLASQLMELQKSLRDDQSAVAVELNHLRQVLLASPELEAFIIGWMQSLQNQFGKWLAQGEQDFTGLADMVLASLSTALLVDPEKQQQINQALLQLCVFMLENYSHLVTGFIEKQMMSWDVQFMVSKIEQEVGNDLQMIRINGVVVGSLIGAVLGGVELLLGT